MTNILIGTSSWTDPTLVKHGHFYPPDAKPPAAAAVRMKLGTGKAVEAPLKTLPAQVRVPVKDVRFKLAFQNGKAAIRFLTVT